MKKQYIARASQIAWLSSVSIFTALATVSICGALAAGAAFPPIAGVYIALAVCAIVNIYGAELNYRQAERDKGFIVPDASVAKITLDGCQRLINTTRSYLQDFKSQNSTEQSRTGYRSRP